MTASRHAFEIDHNTNMSTELFVLGVLVTTRPPSIESGFYFCARSDLDVCYPTYALNGTVDTQAAVSHYYDDYVRLTVGPLNSKKTLPCSRL